MAEILPFFIPPHLRRLRTGLVMALLLPLIFIPFFIGCFELIREGGWQTAGGIFGLLLTAAITVLLILRALDFVRRLRNPSPILEIHPEFLINRSFGSEQRIPWKAIRSIENRNAYFAIFVEDPENYLDAQGYYDRRNRKSALRNRGTPVLIVMHFVQIEPWELEARLLRAWLDGKGSQ